MNSGNVKTHIYKILKMIGLYKQRTRGRMPTCRYHPTCSSYAQVAYEKHNFLYASLLSVWRILRCNPISKGGFDPVPKTRKEKRDEI